MPGPPEFLGAAWPVLLAYVAGATPFGFLAGKMRGIDLREHGSGNIGATNALRTLGKPVGIAVLVLDILKGLLPVLVAVLVSDSSLLHVAAVLAAVLGHNYTFWLGFKGGKGIATTAGALLPVLPVALLVAVAVWLTLLKTTRYVSVASLGAALSVPLSVCAGALLRGAWDPVLLALAFAVCALAVWKHRCNIGRLRRGEELRFQPKPRRKAGEDPATPPSPPSPDEPSP